MSWLQENYEKAVLGGAVVAALGLGFLVFQNMGAVDEDFSMPSLNPKNADLAPGVAPCEEALAEMNSKIQIRQPVDPTGRDVDLLTGIALFANKSSDKPVDLLKEEKPVHPPIPNTWWLEYRIDPSFANSPQLDPDGDGFTNLEEFEGKTDPSDATKYPPLINKLRLTSLTKKDMKLKCAEASGKYNVKYNFSGAGMDQIPRKMRRNNSGYVDIGTVIFDDEPKKGRFKIDSGETREEVNERTKVVNKRQFVILEDLSANKKGRKYAVTSAAKGTIISDYTATFVLKAIGQGGNAFEVTEGATFSLPAGGEPQSYRFLSVDDQGKVVVEYKDASNQTKTIKIGL